MVSYAKRAVKSSILILLMTIISSFFSYFIRVMMARKLSPAEFGLFYSVFTFVLFFLFFRDLGIGAALAKYLPEFNIKKRYNDIKTAIFSVFLFQTISSIIFSAVFFFLADSLAIHYFKNPASSLMLKILIFYVIFSVFFINQKNILFGFQSMTWFSVSEPLKSFIVFIFLILFFNMGLNIYAPVLSYVLVCIVLSLLLLVPTLKTFHFKKYKILKFWPTTSKIFSFGLPVMLTSIGGTVIGYTDTLMLTGFRSLEEVGIYNVVLPSAIIILTLGSTAARILLPMTSELWALKDKKRLTEGLRLLHRYSFVVTIPFVMAIFSYSSFFINLFFGEEYVSGALALQIILIGVLFYVVATVNNNIISGIGKPKTVTYIIFIAAFANVLLNLIFIPIYGINGAAVATSFSYLLVLILSTIKVSKYIELNYPFFEWAKLMFSGIVFLLVVHFTDIYVNLNAWFDMIISGIIGGVVYLALIYLMHVIDINEIKKYSKILR
ncbi:MAG: flippase [Nanoarchaeota archaeon]|nr:flippase [Nanoarchaeota archaeon]MBU1703785.1 flippase [Nanoarchaeota archaeon]